MQHPRWGQAGPKLPRAGLPLTNTAWIVQAPDPWHWKLMGSPVLSGAVLWTAEPKSPGGASPDHQGEAWLTEPRGAQRPTLGPTRGPREGGTATPHREQAAPPGGRVPCVGGRSACADRAQAVPGLKRTMARRQPSSVLSMCMSLILDTSSVSTLQGEQVSHKAHSKPHPSPGPPRNTHRSQGAQCDAGRPLRRARPNGGCQDRSNICPTPGWALSSAWRGSVCGVLFWDPADYGGTS